MLVLDAPTLMLQNPYFSNYYFALLSLIVFSLILEFLVLNVFATEMELSGHISPENGAMSLLFSLFGNLMHT